MLVKGRCGSASEEARMRGALYRRGGEKTRPRLLGGGQRRGDGGVSPLV